VVATRPVAQNGLGLSIPEATSELMRLKGMFPLLPDTPAIYPVWENLVIQYRVPGKPAHDARLVAAMQVHGLSSILTFDKTGFFPLRRCWSCASCGRHQLITPAPLFSPARKAAKSFEVLHAPPGPPPQHRVSIAPLLRVARLSVLVARITLRCATTHDLSWLSKTSRSFCPHGFGNH
jgi:hypothetical protein